MAVGGGSDRGEEDNEEQVLLHLAGKPAMVMKEGWQNVVENEE